ncbi:MAG TPA: phosphatidylserine decarboxylase family protein [Flavobacteriales bacterium]|nr:phosphatidylserine decarboxylase family protein [Flavobacteriales bacterium]
MTFHREGVTTLILFLAAGSSLVVVAKAWLPLWSFYVVCLGVAVVLALVVNFFRMPSRRLGTTDPHEILAPSDGKVVVIEKVHEPEWFNDERIQVSIFMSPLNVHAQWSPIAGKVKAARYHPGKYLVAWHPKSSTENERTTHVIEGERGTVLFRQIAGAVARRICHYMKEGQVLAQGDEVGFIKFGSRIDVFLPVGSEICVELEEAVTGRETVLARFPNA